MDSHLVAKYHRINERGNAKMKKLKSAIKFIMRLIITPFLTRIRLIVRDEAKTFSSQRETKLLQQINKSETLSKKMETEVCNLQQKLLLAERQVHQLSSTEKTVYKTKKALFYVEDNYRHPEFWMPCNKHSIG